MLTRAFGVGAMLFLALAAVPSAVEASSPVADANLVLVVGDGHVLVLWGGDAASFPAVSVPVADLPEGIGLAVVADLGGDLDAMARHPHQATVANILGPATDPHADACASVSPTTLSLAIRIKDCIRLSVPSSVWG